VTGAGDTDGESVQAGENRARHHPVARAIVAQWRKLCGGRDLRDSDRATLVACSAGVDSSALALALGGVNTLIVVGHVVHDLRSRAEALGDRDAARALADRLGVAFAEREAPVRDRGENLESAARSARYAALESMAREHACRFVATAHHADDQLETVLMRLIRGSGPRGLGGIAPTRLMGRRSDSVTIVRPMLGMDREQGLRLCRDLGWTWREDASNRDETYFRNALRARVLPEIKAIRSDAAERAAVTAEVCRLAADAIERRARLILNRATKELDDSPHMLRLDRKTLAAAPMAVRCEALRMMLRDFGGTGLDRAGWSVLEPAASSIGDGRTEPRTHRVGSIVLAVRAHEVLVSEAVS